MSMRTDFEVDISVVGSPEFKFEIDDLSELVEFLQIYEVPVSQGDGVDLESYCLISTDGRSVSMMVRETHPDEFNLCAFSKAHPDVTFRVSEYVHERTEMSDAGRHVYWLQNGDQISNKEMKDRLLRLFAERRLLFSYAVTSEKWYWFPPEDAHNPDKWKGGCDSFMKMIKAAIRSGTGT